MSSSTVTYTFIYINSEPGRVYWGADEELSDGGFPRVIVHGYDRLLTQPVAPPSPNYVQGPEHPLSLNYVSGPDHPPSPVEVPYVPEPEHPKYLVPFKDGAPIVDQPLPTDVLPTALSPDYVADSDLDEDPMEDPEKDHDEYLADGGDAGDTKAFKTDESAPTPISPQTRVPFSQTSLCMAQKTIRLDPPMSASMETRIVKHAAALTPPLPVTSPPLPLPSPLTTSPTDAGGPLEVEESSTAGTARQPWPTLEADLRRYEVEDIVEAMMEIALTTLEGVNQKVTELATTVSKPLDFFHLSLGIFNSHSTFSRGGLMPCGMIDFRGVGEGMLKSRIKIFNFLTGGSSPKDHQST
nr:hypothetical protein [Tanacetum cinerariifolium]